MSRAKATDVSSPISLFPFIGVLLSTMGALLVVLIAVSRSAHDVAVREVAAQKAAAATEGQQDARQKFEQVNQYVARLNSVRAEAETRRRDDQLRLSHVEDHMRRLKEQLQTLQNSAYELASLEGEHYDDRKQAEREVDRLGQLITDSREAIASLKDENKSKKRSYAIIPYDGPHGTRRRPIYIECRKDEVLLQPEGISLTPEDFRPPLGAGNPLAAALRAAREYIVRQEGDPSPNKDTEPYPLVLVRPNGILAYYRVREAIESWDAAFGYELVDSDWKLEFPPSNPLLAEIEHQAVEQSRTRQQMLVAAAPRAYGSRHVAASGGFDDKEEFEGDDGEFSDDGGGGYGDGYGSGNGSGDGTGGGFGDGGGHGDGDGVGGPYAVDANENGVNGEFFGDGAPHGSGGEHVETGHSSQRSGHGGEVRNGLVGVAGAGPDTTADGGGGAAGGTAASDPAGAVGAAGSGSGGMPQSPGQQPGTSINVVAGTPTDDGTNPRGSVAPLPPSATGASLADGVGEANLMAGNRTANGPSGVRASNAASSASTGEPSERMPLDMQMNVQQRIPSNTRGQNWAIKGRAPTSVPIRRTIRVVVRADRLAIQPDSSQKSARAVTGREIPLQGPTVARLDDFVMAVQDRVHEWGLAGSGMYWRPVLLLDVGPDGQRRADDLARLLKNSGIEIRDEATANRTQEGPSSATR